MPLQSEPSPQLGDGKRLEDARTKKMKHSVTIGADGF